MCVLGITVRTTKGRPHLRGVVLDQGKVTRTFQHLPSTAHALPEQIHGLADALRTELTALPGALDAVVVREADDGVRGGLTAGRKARARAEGAVLDIARQRTTKVAVMNGPQVGRACGGNLAAAESRAAAQVESQWVEPASAALAAETL